MVPGFYFLLFFLPLFVLIIISSSIMHACTHSSVRVVLVACFMLSCVACLVKLLLLTVVWRQVLRKQLLPFWGSVLKRLLLLTVFKFSVTDSMLHVIVLVHAQAVPLVVGLACLFQWAGCCMC